jgi:hypothetical protein
MSGGSNTCESADTSLKGSMLFDLKIALLKGITTPSPGPLYSLSLERIPTSPSQEPERTGQSSMVPPNAASAMPTAG